MNRHLLPRQLVHPSLEQQYNTLDAKPGGSVNRFLHTQDSAVTTVLHFCWLMKEYHLSCFDVRSFVTDYHKSKAKCPMVKESFVLTGPEFPLSSQTRRF